MENRLRSLIEANSERDRRVWAQELKKQGKKIIGFLCPYVVEEAIYAAGMHPWRVTGTWGADVGLALTYRPANAELYYTHALQSLLLGDLDFLDGVVFTNYDIDMVRLYDVWTAIGRTPSVHIMDIPRQDGRLARDAMVSETYKLVRWLEKVGDKALTEYSLVQPLREAIAVYNKTRTLLRSLYELRKREVPPISGAEALGITTAATILPNDYFNRELEGLLPYLEQRRTSLAQSSPRLLVSADRLDNPAYLQVVEETGALIAMDDLELGSRYFWGLVDTEEEKPVRALAVRYLCRVGEPRMVDWDRQASQVIEWVREWRIDGVVEFVQRYSLPREFRVPFFKDQLNKAGIPIVSIQREYWLANVGQIQTRVGAFVEILRERGT